MLEIIISVAKFIKALLDASVPVLSVMLCGITLLWVILVIKQAKPFEKEIACFRRLTLINKITLIVLLCSFTWWGGAKESGNRGNSGDSGRVTMAMREGGDGQLRSLPQELADSTNLLEVTAFEISQTNAVVAFEMSWATNLFDYVDSRGLYLFVSTNLSDNVWFPMGQYMMPEGTNAYAFVISENSVESSMRQWFRDTFGGMGFYRFGVDFDSDSDGIADVIEQYWTLTDPENPDTDGDGLLDGAELLSNTTTNPLAYDTDGDGVGDGDEILARTSPRRGDSDHDGLSDAQELGSMVALIDDGFMWFDISEGTNLLAGVATANNSSWQLPLDIETIINNTCYTNIKIHVDGTVHLLCPTNLTARADPCNFGSLGNSQYSTCSVTIAAFGADLYARTANWGSAILCDTVTSSNRRYAVVEYRNMGLHALDNTNELMSWQVILPEDETNTVYVSYLCASNSFRAVSAVAGIQCGWMQSWKTDELYYNLTWPCDADFPVDGMTIKYSIGTGTNPVKFDTDEDGLSDFEEVFGGYSDPFLQDTDGDFIPDGIEVSIGTNPSSNDSDCDGMPDGWEVQFGLDPTTNDANNDIDPYGNDYGDNLINLAEYRVGTNPQDADSDDDGLLDGEEFGWWEYVATLPAFSMASATNLLNSSWNYDNDKFVLTLPFPFKCAGYTHTNMTVCIDGMVGLMSDRCNFLFGPSGSNCELLANGTDYYHTMIAAYWDDLYAKNNSGAQIKVADETVGGRRYVVIEYSSIRLREQKDNPDITGSFQIIIPQAENNTVYVRYLNMTSGFTGESATIGAQLPSREKAFQIGFNRAGAITNGTIIAYHMGSGSSPLVADTDGDGVFDGAEVVLGTSALFNDTDQDGLDDGWEIQYGLSPLSSGGQNGANGDVDGDHLPNAKEKSYNINPASSDSDGDGLLDGDETGCIFAGNSLPWLAFSSSEDLTIAITNANKRCVARPLPQAFPIQGENVTNITLSANGVLFFNRPGYANQGNSSSGFTFLNALDASTLVLAPHMLYSYFRSDIVGRESSVKMGTATYDDVQYLLIEYANIYRNSNSSLSFQVAIPMSAPYRAYVRYKDLYGSYMTGEYASIGMQTFDGKWLHSYCYHEGGRISEGLGLEFVFGYNSNPCVYDMDGDGLSDGQEAQIGTFPDVADTDGDGLLDGWEVQNNLNAFIATGDNGANGDPDEDGLCNLSEYEHGTNPQVADSDQDGLPDGAEIQHNSNPMLADTDGDGVLDGVEVNTYGSNPCLSDTDGDGLTDAQEIAIGTSPCNMDTDGDGLLDAWELANNLNPLSSVGNDGALADLDNDGLNNLQEQMYGGNPRNADTDNDGLSDAQEVLNGTNISNVDTDNDGLTDKQEIDLSCNPLDIDMDRDGMLDGWEVYNGLSPVSTNGVNGADGDLDGDGLSNIEEYLNGTNPDLCDSDGDGISDLIEVENGSDPNDASDGGIAPSESLLREIEFNINGDYAAWELNIAGLDQNDTRERKISMGYPYCGNTTLLTMRKGCSYRLSMRWLNCDGHNDAMSPWYCWQAKIDGLPDGATFASYTDTRRVGYETIVGDGWIVDNTDGLLTAHVHECTQMNDGSFGGGNVAGSLLATLYVLDAPQLIPDYDRDGVIGTNDVNNAVLGKAFRFWVNDDMDENSAYGKYAESANIDIPHSASSWWTYIFQGSDGTDDYVNGYRDLIDFTPIFLDISAIQALPENIRTNLTFKLRQDDGAINVVWTGLSKDEVENFQKTDVGVCGRGMNENSFESTVEQVTATGIEVPDELVAQMLEAEGKGVVFVEGRKATTSPLKLDVYYGNQKVVTGELPLSISSVDKMYRWLNVRGMSGEGVEYPSYTGEPENWSDADTSGKHLVFVHGANVAQNESRGWAAEVYKRLWQSGMTAKFTAVSWRSDIGSSANYQENVSNAFFTASILAPQIDELPGVKVLMAHSLGNMVCSSMIQDYELVPDCYLMCNSAVPAEAYDLDSILRVPQLVHPEWVEYPTNSWASSWHWLFRNEPNDDRKHLGWTGRFSNVAQYAVNFYSMGDEVLELAGNNNVHTWTGISDSWGHYSWHKQELFKGRGGIGGTDWAGWNIEENWLGVNKISVAEAQTMTEADFRTNTVFYCYPQSMNSTNINLLVRGAHLAQGIPALTPATGRCALPNVLNEGMNVDLDDAQHQNGIIRPNGWPERFDYQGQWCHSDLKDVAYFYVFKFYEKVIEKGNLK